MPTLVLALSGCASATAPESASAWVPLVALMVASPPMVIVRPAALM